ncbi:MAG TPA: HAD family hydrolase [Candidatus Saccharimonadales bacterium]
MAETKAIVFDFYDVIWDDRQVDDGVVAIIKELRATGKYKVALISNSGPDTLHNFLDELELADLFDVILPTGATAYMKPAREVYEILEDMLQVPFEEWFYTDDAADYITQAQEYGIPSHLFASADNLRSALRERGILA